MHHSIWQRTVTPALSIAMTMSFATGPAARAATIWTNPITETNPSAANPYTAGQTVDPNLTVSGIGRGSGVTANAGANRYNAASWNTTFDANDYFTFTLTPNAGEQLSLNSLIYTAQASGTGPNTFAFRSSADNFTGNIGAPTATGTTINLGGASFQNDTAPLTFRLYGYGGTSAAGTFSVNDFTFDGALSPAAVANSAPVFAGTKAYMTSSNTEPPLPGGTSVYNGSATDADGNAITFAASNLPAFLTLTQNAAAGTYSLVANRLVSDADDGVYTIGLSANDGNGGTDAASLSLTLVPEPASLAVFAVAGAMAFRRRAK